MLLFNQEVFDDIIDTTNWWYTSSDYNELLGRADALLRVVYPTLVGGTSPTLTVWLDQSNDNQHWFQPFGNMINTQPLVNNQLMQGWVVNGFSSIFAFCRIRIGLGGTNPTCQLKMTMVGRST